MKSFKQFQEALIAKGAGKLDSEVLKQNPDLDPTKPRDYMKLKRMQKKLAPKVDLALNTEEAIARYAGMAESLSASLKYAGVAFRNGELVLQSKDAGASKFDTSVTKEVPDYLGGAIVRTPSRFLNATDEFPNYWETYQGARIFKNHLMKLYPCDS